MLLPFAPFLFAMFAGFSQEPVEAPYTFAEKYTDAFKEAAERNVPVIILDFDFWIGSAVPLLSDQSFRSEAQGAILMLSSGDSHDTPNPNRPWPQAAGMRCVWRCHL